MKYKELIDKILEKSNNILEEVEVFISLNERLAIDSFQGEISKYEISETGGLSLRGIYNGKMGYSYTEKLDESVIDELISNVKDNSKFLEGEEEFIHQGSGSYKEIPEQTYDIDRVSIEDKIEYLLNLEVEMEKLDPMISEKMAYYSEFKSKRYIGNTKGLFLEDSFSGAVVSASAVAKKEGSTKTGSSYRLFKHMDDKVDYKILAKEAVKDALSKLDARSLKSDDYPILIENDTFSSLLASFTSLFSAEAVQKDLSLLKGKIGEKIASPMFNLVDDPFVDKGFGSRNFDDEGVACKFKNVIEDGVLKEFLYNLKTANKDGVKSTGNAARSYKGSIGISPTNFYVVSGDSSFEELLIDGEGGIYIDSLQGLHSGLNPVSGDFSLSAEGHIIKDGKLDRAVDQITIAGNFFDLLKDIIAVGDDFKFGRSGGGAIGSPSILVKSLSVSGEESQ